jgi:hypothetical protein
MKILKDMLHHTPNAKEPEIFLKGMPCPRNIIYKLTYSMCEELHGGPPKTHTDLSIF